MEVPKLSSLIKVCLAGLNDRQQEILEGRYGLVKADSLTLAELGGQYGLTRERVRQIEALALKASRQKTGNSEFSEFVKNVSVVLKSAGGLKREDLLIGDLVKTSNITPEQANRVKFLLEICAKFSFSKDDKDFFPYWYLTEADQKKAVGFIGSLVKIADRSDFSASFAAVSKNSGLNEATARNYAAISKKVAMNIYGDLGLSDWPEINPKTARDWAYLVLKKEQKPLHFNDIAVAVTKLRNKPAHAPTVHNELIKDENFVLVGKGTYTLKEFGVTPGTAREIIAHYLKQHGPLSAKEVVKKVLNERLFKENTVLINLQNRKNFKRLDDGRYSILA
ncbi:MAG: sigma factor-like helix-turn-helix DNA-binding protein [bacterium]|nr:sigma factor-like helix-turn-helix DNA-binding protein [bacterium]